MNDNLNGSIGSDRFDYNIIKFDSIHAVCSYTSYNIAIDLPG